MRSNDREPRTGPVENREPTMFTGVVWGEVLLPFEENVSVNRVTFPAGSRTAWHRHEGGQILLGQAGAGLVVTQDGEVSAIGDGVVVHGAAGEEHWHGALPGSFMTHVSVVMGGTTHWGDEVTPEEYEQAVQQLTSDSGQPSRRPGT
jgi:quercetin dioxygenase-like cupin family protein